MYYYYFEENIVIWHVMGLKDALQDSISFFFFYLIIDFIMLAKIS